MNTTDFDYELPPEFIAQSPVEPRDSARLLVMNRQTGALTHRKFREVAAYLRPGDLLVMNDSRVIPARIKARKATDGSVEILLLRRAAPLTWEVLIGGKAVHLGSKLEVEGRLGLSAVVMQEFDDARRMVQFSEPITPLMESVGSVPLPPYIREPLADPERYQTVYAKTRGSAAAPTAGLHFTPELLASLAAAGVRQAFVTLHIGLDTFAPITEDRIEAHAIHTEWCQLPRETAITVNETRAAGGRVIAVGTTAVRVLESAARASSPDEKGIGYTRPLTLSPTMKTGGLIQPVVGNTGLFITPGFEFKVVNGLITNFHLPRSTLVLLVSAFAGRDPLLAAYEKAKAEGYRFYSFGDAMLIL